MICRSALADVFSHGSFGESMAANKKPGTKERELQLKESSSKRWDHICAFPFFLTEKLISWPVAIVFLGYFFFVAGAEHFAGKDTSLAVRAIIDLGSKDAVKWIVIGILSAGHLVWFFLR